MISCRSPAQWRCGRCRMASASSTRCNPAPRSRRSTISMIAKIISHGADRNEARGRLICGLEQTAAFGVTTNQGFLISCLRHPGFAKGEATTAFIGNHRDELLAPRADDKAEAALAALAALRHQSACAALARRAQSGSDVSADDADRSRPWRAGGGHRARTRWQLCRRRRWQRAAVRD